MNDPIQTSIPGSDVPPEPVRAKRGRPVGSKTRKTGSLFSDGQGDYRLFVVEEQTGGLTPVADAPGFFECQKATAWLRQFGGREDLLGRSILVIRAMHMIRTALAPMLQYKPRPKLAARPRAEKAVTAPEPEPVSS